MADVWACFGGEDHGAFGDIDKITMFADYRVPQILNAMGCLYYSPSLTVAIKDGKALETGDRWEMQLRGERVASATRLRRDWTNRAIGLQRVASGVLSCFAGRF